MDPEAIDPAPHPAGQRSAQAWLRAVTADAHARAESAVMRALQPLSAARYGAYLQGVHALYAPLEPQLYGDALAGLLPDAAERRKVPWLLEDLAALGLAPRAPRAEAPRSDHTIVPRDPLERWGAAYVLEGATLGGPVLLARLRAQGLLLDRERGGFRFLLGYGPRAGAMWHAFRTQLQRAVTMRSDWTALGAGALGMFAAFEAAIAREGEP